MENIKIRYTWKSKDDGHLIVRIFEISEIEYGIKDRIPSGYDLLGRDLLTESEDKNGTPLFENDLLKYHMGNGGIYLMGRSDIEEFDQYSHDQQIAFEDPNEWEKVGDIYTSPELVKK